MKYVSSVMWLCLVIVPVTESCRHSSYVPSGTEATMRSWLLRKPERAAGYDPVRVHVAPCAAQ